MIKPEIKQQKLSRKARFKFFIRRTRKSKKIEELTDETCRWPIGHPSEERFLFLW